MKNLLINHFKSVKILMQSSCQKVLIFKKLQFLLIFIFIVNQALSQNTFPESGSFILPAGKSIVITYEVDVNADACSGTIVTNLEAQGTVSGSNFPNVLTDDASVAGTTNPTITPFAPLTLPTATNISVTHDVAQPNFVNGCEILCTIVPLGVVSPVSGNIEVRAWKESAPFSFMRRHYEITPTAGSSATVTLYYTQADFTDYNTSNLIKLPINAADAANNKANLQLIKYPGTSPNGLPGGYMPNTPVEVTPRTVVWDAAGYWKVTFDVSSFSGFFVKTGSAPLPVTLISFYGKKTGENENTLTWKTSSEKIFSHFEIESSVDAKKFMKIGKVIGNKSETYEFIESNSSFIIHHSSLFYRLKMVDLDGSSTFSKIIAIENSVEKSAVGQFYPNPSLGKSDIDIFAKEKEIWNITTFDLTGKTLKSETRFLQKGLNKISIENLNKGINFVRFGNGQKSEIRKVIQD